MGVECIFCANPHIGAIVNSLPLQLERCAVPDIIANVFLVDQNLVNCAACPSSAKIGSNPALIQKLAISRSSLPSLTNER